MFLWLLMTAIGFLSGSVMYSYLIPKLARGVDARQSSEDENPGSTNAIAAAGLPIGLLCLGLDLLKAFAPVFVAVSILDIRGMPLVPVVVSPVLGHAFSPFLRFKGGKAVAASFGALLGAVGISMTVFILVVAMALFKFILVLTPDSAKVYAGFAGASIAVFFLEPLMEMRVSMLLISAVVLYKHAKYFDFDNLGLAVGPFSVRYADKELKFAGPGVHKK